MSAVNFKTFELGFTYFRLLPRPALTTFLDDIWSLNRFICCCVFLLFTYDLHFFVSFIIFLFLPVSSLPSSQYRVSFVDDRVAARSRDRFPLITTHSATPVQTLEDNGSYTNSVSRNHQSPKQRSRHHTQYSSVDRTYKHHCRSDKSPVAVSPSTNVRHSTFLQPASHVSTPPDHSYHLKNLLSYKSHRHT